MNQEEDCFDALQKEFTIYQKTSCLFDVNYKIKYDHVEEKIICTSIYFPCYFYEFYCMELFFVTKLKNQILEFTIMDYSNEMKFTRQIKWQFQDPQLFENIFEIFCFFEKKRKLLHQESTLLKNRSFP